MKRLTSPRQLHPAQKAEFVHLEQEGIISMDKSEEGWCHTMDPYYYGLPCEGGWNASLGVISWNCWHCGRRILSEEKYFEKVRNL
jgi:hypothetical protein